MLSANGKTFDVDAFLEDSSLRDIATVFRLGEQAGGRPARQYSGLRIDIGDIDEDLLEPKLRDAVKFINDYRSEVERLASFPGVDECEIGIGLFWLPDTACYPMTLPPDFLALVGGCGLSVTLYLYAAEVDGSGC